MSTSVGIPTPRRGRRVMAAALTALTIAAGGCETGRTLAPNGVGTFDAPWSVEAPDGARIFRTVTKFPSNSPLGVAVRQDGIGLVTHPNTNLVSVIDAARPSVIGVITVGNGPSAVAFSPSGGTAYVTNQFDGTVGVVNMATRTQTDTILVFEPTISVAVSLDGAHVYVGTLYGNIHSFSTATLALEGTVGTVFFNGISDLALDPTGGHLYATGGSQYVYDVDLSTFTIVRSFIVGGNAQAVSVSGSGARLIVANYMSYLSDLELSTGLLLNIGLPSAATDVVEVASAGISILVMPQAASVIVYDEQLRQLGQSLFLGGSPQRGALHARTRTLVVTDNSGFIDFIR